MSLYTATTKFLQWRSHRGLSLVLTTSLISLIYYWWGTYSHETTDIGMIDILYENKDHCARLPGAEDILVTLKTGATEIHRKLPVHFSTTFRCTPNYMIYSDMEEEIQGYKIHDALAKVNETIKATNSEFKLYQELKDLRSQHKFWESIGEEYSKDAWNLDKWKFLPLLDEALERMPAAKWYVFIEADTYLVWWNLLQWLSKFDSSQDLYLGGQSFLNDIAFAHGGTGYVLSNSAVRKVVDDRAKRLDVYDKMTQDEWAGDFVLARALKNVGISLTPSWPMAQGETPSSLDYSNRLWCYPVISYHHMTASEINEMWYFEQNWLAKSTTRTIQIPMLHRDVFNGLIDPLIQAPTDDWNNLSLEWNELLETPTFENCRDACIERESCWQFSLVNGTCKSAGYTRLGRQKDTDDNGAQSGWMLDRIAAFKRGLENCEPIWILE